MSEFKAQLLGVIIVISLFGFIKGFADDMTSKTYNTIEDYYSAQLSENFGVSAP